MTYLAASAANAFMWITVFYMICLAVSVCGGAKGGAKSIGGLFLMCAILVRVCWIVTIPIVFHRVNESYDIC